MRSFRRSYAVRGHDKLDAVFREIQRSNMSKLGTDGKPIYREDGKVMKGPEYFKPDIATILAK
jgi:predicted HAD superfamily Cof-like phosphohydrolase